MANMNFSDMLAATVEQLSEPQRLKGVFHPHGDGHPLPSGAVLEEIVLLLRSILFPGYYGKSSVNIHTLHYHIGVGVERLHHLLTQQIEAGLCFMETEGTTAVSSGIHPESASKQQSARELSALMIDRLPQIRSTLATDVMAAYNGDPAACSTSEVIACYPIIKALTNYRVAHELHLLGVPLIPRMLTEMAHSETGIDIHPQATIGKYFTIDHGTGVVIGATCIIGDNVKIYQGVTLGAKSFPLDDDGNPIKGIARHPIIGNNVVIYANATVLGRITIGDNCVVGANVWVTDDMDAHTTKVKRF